MRVGALQIDGGSLPRLGRLVGQGDILLALGVVAILVVLILPLPGLLLDLLLAISITLAVLVLLTALFIERPLDFNVFPTVLLITTMFRLALNLASTRLILAEGHSGTAAAGHVIEAFGGFIMQGNFIIGMIVFAILVIVNFVVITKGSSRIAEVAARFSLDAMPGKQMAIDADLSAGLIDEETARQRRRTLEEESSFFGAMDGAAKFVRGDAVAGLLITAINLIGGLLVGVGQMGVSLAEAAHSYTLLTVGDGLVSQIPALIVSTAAGLLVTKGGVAQRADRALFGQLGAFPRAMGVTAVLSSVLALLPGLPALPFLAIGATAGWMARLGSLRAAGSAAAPFEAPPPAAPAEEPIATALAMDAIRLELGYGLLSLIGDGPGRRLPDQIRILRRQLASELGFLMPSVRIQDNIQLPAQAYVIRLKEMEIGRGELRPGMLLVMDPQGGRIALPGEETTEPTFGLAAMWVAGHLRDEATRRGLTVVDPVTVVATHLTQIVKDNLADLLTYTETQKLLGELGDDYRKLLADLVPARISASGIQRVLQGLLAERISIRDLATIVEAIAEAAPSTQSILRIIEHVRSRLARQISAACADATGQIPMLILGPSWEQAFAEALVGSGDDRQLTMSPSQLQQFVREAGELFESLAMRGEMPVLVTTPPIRPYVRAVVERVRPATVVLSQNEIHPRAKLRHLGQV
jgi:flagellar biosynthesis protein FlhA